METTANDPGCADDIAGEIWMQYPLRLWALAERNARSGSSSIILTIFKQIFTNMHQHNLLILPPEGGCCPQDEAGVWAPDLPFQ